MPNILHKLADKLAGNDHSSKVGPSSSSGSGSAPYEAAPAHGGVLESSGSDARMSSGDTDEQRTSSHAGGENYSQDSVARGTNQQPASYGTTTSSQTSSDTGLDSSRDTSAGNTLGTLPEQQSLSGDTSNVDQTGLQTGSNTDISSESSARPAEGTSSSSERPLVYSGDTRGDSNQSAGDASALGTSTTSAPKSDQLFSFGGSKTTAQDTSSVDATVPSAAQQTDSKLSSGIKSAMSSSDSPTARTQGGGKTTVKNATPIVVEHVHDEYMHVYKTKVDEIHERTEIVQIIQPIRDLQIDNLDRSTVHEGTEVRHHHASAEQSELTERQLAEAREEFIRSAGYVGSQDERHYRRTDPTKVNRVDRVQRIEQIVPVFESELKAAQQDQQQNQQQQL